MSKKVKSNAEIPFDVKKTTVNDVTIQTSEEFCPSASIKVCSCSLALFLKSAMLSARRSTASGDSCFGGGEEPFVVGAPLDGDGGDGDDFDGETALLLLLLLWWLETAARRD